MSPASPASIRRARLLAWLLSLIAAALLVLTIASVWLHLWIAVSDKYLGIFHGQLACRWGFERPALNILSPGIHFRRFDAMWEWWRPPYQLVTPAIYALNCPLILPFTLTTIAAALAIRRSRALRARGRCPACLYNLAGLTFPPRCPECGRPFARSR